MTIFLGLAFFYLAPAAIIAAVAYWFMLEHRKDRVPILLYHRFISRADVESGRAVDDEMIWAAYDDVFSGQMEYLAKSGYTTLDMDDYLAVQQGSMPRPAKPVVITFDDGYLSNYTLAFPALKRWGHKAVIYVAPEPDEYSRKLVAGRDDWLNAEQMREMTAAGIAIESHTLTHCVLNELSDDGIRYELMESRRRLTDMTQRPVRHLAIARAGHSRRVRRIVAETGYLTACCNAKGSANRGSDLLALPRFVVERDTSVGDFARLLTPGTGAVLRVIGNLKRIPEWIGGSGFAGRVRRALYRPPFGALFETRRLKYIVAFCAASYAAGAAFFTWRLLQGGK